MRKLAEEKIQQHPPAAKKAKSQEISTSPALQFRPPNPFPPCWHKVLDLSYKKQVIALYLMPSTTNLEELKVKSDSARRVILLSFVLEMPPSTFYAIFKGVLKEDPSLTQELTENTTLVHRLIEIEIPWPEHVVKLSACVLRSGVLGCVFDKIHTHEVEEVTVLSTTEETDDY